MPLLAKITWPVWSTHKMVQNGGMDPCFILNRLLDIAHVVIRYITLPTPYTHQISTKTTKNFQLTKYQKTWICWIFWNIGCHNMCNGKLSCNGKCVLLQTSAVKGFNVLEQHKYQGTIVFRTELGSTFSVFKRKTPTFYFPIFTSQ